MSFAAAAPTITVHLGLRRMGKQRNKRARAAKQHGMDVEEGGDVAATAAANADWQTGPVDGHDDDDAAGMDTGEAVAAAGQLNGQTRSKQFLKVKRGARSAKQKQRKRKSLERALATADKVDTKTAREGSRVASKKSLKKLWTNSKGECGGK